jgi:hypothetical protein
MRLDGSRRSVKLNLGRNEICDTKPENQVQFHSIDRGDDAFQVSVTTEEIDEIARRVFGQSACVDSAVELGAGMYNSTYRMSLVGEDRPVILRIGPKPEHQFRSEFQLMRNEYASIPWLSPIAFMMPTVIAADWSHDIVDRDYLVQSMLDGIAAPDRLGDYPRSTWGAYFHQMGSIAAVIHAIRGPGFGPIAGPTYPTLSQAVIASLEAIASDIDNAGLRSGDVRDVADCARDNHAMLDEITEPRMLSGDLWTVNVMLAADAAVPTITGLFDIDRTWWGDPLADWPIRMAAAKPGTERDAFWDGYGPRDLSPNAMWRSWVYEARHVGANRLERHRLGNAAGVADTYAAMAAILAELGGTSGSR